MEKSDEFIEGVNQGSHKDLYMDFGVPYLLPCIHSSHMRENSGMSEVSTSMQQGHFEV
jgi:hypothetical protein